VPRDNGEGKGNCTALLLHPNERSLDSIKLLNKAFER
jgi:hypothetical protein